MLLSTQAIKEGKNDNGRPFRALEIEFTGLVEVLPPRALKALRKIRIWVEWDNIDRQSPRTLAKYFGGNIWALDPGEPMTHVLRPGDVAQVLAAGSPYDRPVAEAARFTVGDRVRTRNLHPTGHTRLPRYARAKEGVIERLHGGFVFPDTNAHGAGECPQWLYTVRFEARELWGDSADPALTVAIDAWESYLDPA